MGRGVWRGLAWRLKATQGEGVANGEPASRGKKRGSFFHVQNGLPTTKSWHEGASHETLTHPGQMHFSIEIVSKNSSSDAKRGKSIPSIDCLGIFPC